MIDVNTRWVWPLVLIGVAIAFSLNGSMHNILRRNRRNIRATTEERPF